MVFLNCDLCDFSAADKNLMDRHMMKHTGRVIFTCHSCEFEATKQALLENHIEKIHGNNKPWWYEAEATNHQCERCEEHLNIFLLRDITIAFRNQNTLVLNVISWPSLCMNS